MLESIDKSLRVIVGAINIIQKVCVSVWNFIMDPITILKGVADPIFLAVMAALIILKAFGIDTSIHMKVTFLVYIILLVL